MLRPVWPRSRYVDSGVSGNNLVLADQIKLKIMTQLQSDNIAGGAVAVPSVKDMIRGDRERTGARVQEKGGAIADAVLSLILADDPVQRSGNRCHKFQFGSAKPGGHYRPGFLFVLNRWQHRLYLRKRGVQRSIRLPSSSPSSS